MNRKCMTAVSACMVMMSTFFVFAEDKPPVDAKPLSGIVKSLEDANIGLITSAEFDDGRWEVQVHNDGRWFELSVDPKTGEIKQQRPDDADDDIPPADGLRLSVVIKSVEDAKHGVVTEADFDDGRWEIQTNKDGRWTTLFVDPKTGEIKQPQPKDADNELPPADSLRLSDIVRSVEDQKLGVITDVEFDDGCWEIKIRDGLKRIRLKIDPKTGKNIGA